MKTLERGPRFKRGGLGWKYWRSCDILALLDIFLSKLFGFEVHGVGADGLVFIGRSRVLGWVEMLPSKPPASRVRVVYT